MSTSVMGQAAGETGTVIATTATRPSFYYGWVMLPLSMATLIASSPGQTFGVSIFNEPMRLSLSLTHGQLAAAYMLGTLLGAIPITYIGRQMDRYGLRHTMLAIVTFFSMACVLTSFVQSWLALVAAFCFLRMLGPGALALASGNTLAYWFERRLGTVEGLRQLGMAVAMISIPALNLFLTTRWGWRGAYGILGVGIWLLLFPLLVWLFRNHPAEVGQEIDGPVLPPPTTMPRPARADLTWGLSVGEAVRTTAFWIVTCGTAIFSLIHTAVFFCLVPILEERGLSASDAAATLTTFAVCLAALQLIGGILADSMRSTWLLFLGIAGLAMGVLLLLLAETSTMAVFSGAALGISQGIYYGATNPLWARYFGRRHLGRIRGTLMTINIACSSLGPLLAGTLRDWQGTFTLALVIFAVAPWPIAIFSLLLTPPTPQTHPDASQPSRGIADDRP
jgi:MFS transporter, OFA family, oxalate/formate antiporter